MSNQPKGPYYYVTEERAFAPGISGEWPRVITNPDNPNGRLVMVEGVVDAKELDRLKAAYTLIRGTLCNECRTKRAPHPDDLWGAMPEGVGAGEIKRLRDKAFDQGVKIIDAGEAIRRLRLVLSRIVAHHPGCTTEPRCGGCAYCEAVRELEGPKA